MKLLEHEGHYEARDAMIVVSKWKGFVHTEIWERIGRIILCIGAQAAGQASNKCVKAMLCVCHMHKMM